MEEFIHMIECRTFLTNRNIKALAKYYSKKIKKNKWKSILIFLLGIFLLVVSIVNSYGLWMKYHEIKSVFYIILKSSVLYILSFIILHTSIWGTTQKLYVELNSYFAKLMAEFIDYTISDKGISLTITKNTTLHEWDSITLIESDRNYYYFTCNEKCSIIDKKDMNLNIQNVFESMILEKSIPFKKLHKK